ncbi:coiled-coil domain-containing protein 150-like [Physella acuta]|uniref:coiled-coil domain-containing protein 150-like n=1 Tax=Physella acuta TaxID=109671 RepID=UPI0027DCA676|nr:coiled-coil domain-containing protein 150-like [Physella acuta]XP_059155113.1 coiled-coil domain-containing protein 150-like [Physella acuta]
MKMTSVSEYRPGQESAVETISLKDRLAAAEIGTNEIMQQLEEMGLSSISKGCVSKAVLSKFGSTINKPLSISKDSQKNIPHRNYSDNHSTSIKTQYLDQEQSQETKTLNSQTQLLLNEKSSRTSKHRPITPLSLKEFKISGATGELEVVSKSSNNFIPKSFGSSLEYGPKPKERSDSHEGKSSTKRYELEQELIRLKRHLSQTEDTMQLEAEEKLKMKEEIENLRSLYDDSIKSKAELEFQVEDLATTKQKLMRRISEVKDEALRESSLRKSLEESHATLLTRLQDMEKVIESLRSECKAHTAGISGSKAEIIQLKNELASETTRRQKAEENYQHVISERDKLLLSSNNTQAENQRVSQDLNRLQAQYAELIRQLDQAQSTLDNLTSGKRSLEEEKNVLQNMVQGLTSDLENLKRTYESTKQTELRLEDEKSTLEGDLSKLRTEREKIIKENFEKKRKIDTLEHELRTVKHNLAHKNQEFMSAADGLEYELAGLKDQLEAMESEKQDVLKDKENLLEEVNQTVDTLMSERSRLQTELQACRVDMESLKTTCAHLEQDKAVLLEKVGSLQQHQITQRKVEETLNEMVEQKKRLAYENGRLQSAIKQLQQELVDTAKDQGDLAQLRKLSHSLQEKYTKSQQEISEYKIALQRYEGQTRAAIEEIERKDQELQMALSKLDEAEKDKGKLLKQFEVLEGRQQTKVSSYQRSMEEAKSVNKEIANTLETVMTSHSQLQNIVENLQVELGKRDSQINQLKTLRNKENEEWKQEKKKIEEQAESLRLELRKEKDKNGKKITKELGEIRKQNENLSNRNQELVKANTEIRQKLSELEREQEDLKTKLSGQRHKMEYLHKAKKQLEDNLNKMKTVREDIDELEQMRKEYMKKNVEQGEAIAKFINQISSLQDEMRQLASAHVKAQQLLKMKEEALEKERKIREEMRKKYTESKKKEEQLFKKSQSTDEKLEAVHSESLEISKHLEEAHEWFRGKFDKLQTEITASKQVQAKLEKDNTEQRNSLEAERSKAQEAAEKAKEMIQNSRQTISRLADFAEMADADTKKQLAELRAGLYTKTSGTKSAV